jgi:YbbR domain-containing protein
MRGTRVLFRRVLTNNLNLKIASVIVAVFLWLFAKGEQTGDRLFSIPLIIRNVPEGLTTVERIPESIDVIISGDNKELVKLGFWGEPFAVLDMSEAAADRVFRVSLSPANVILPRDAGVQVVEVRDPKSLDLEVDRRLERRVPVEPSVEGILADGYYMLGDPATIPDSVTIYGPATVVQSFGIVATEPLSISGRRAGVESSRRIQFEGPWNLHAVPREVRVVVDVEGTEVVTLEQVPVEFRHEPGFASVTVDPTVIELQVAGPAHLATGLSEADVDVLIDARGLPRGVHQILPDIRVPDGLVVVSNRPMRFQATLE